MLLLSTGSLVLVGGDPGVGKSTLLLQVFLCCSFVVLLVHPVIPFEQSHLINNTLLEYLNHNFHFQWKIAALIAEGNGRVIYVSGEEVCLLRVFASSTLIFFFCSVTEIGGMLPISLSLTLFVDILSLVLFGQASDFVTNLRHQTMSECETVNIHLFFSFSSLLTLTLFGCRVSIKLGTELTVFVLRLKIFFCIQVLILK